MLTGFVIGDRGLGTAGDTHLPWIMAYALAGPYLVVGASAIGQIHLARGLPRDDAFVIRSIGPWLAVGVADGVGTKPLSRYGATYVTKALTAILLRPFVSLSKANEKPSTQPLLSDQTIAPPAQVEEVELKPPIVEKGSTVEAITSGLIDWSEKVDRAEPVSLDEEFSTDRLRQAASIGWWYVPLLPNSSPEGESCCIQKPESMSPLSNVGEGESPPPPQPNLVEIMLEAFEKTHLGLREHACSLEVELDDLGCTALALLLNLETGCGVVGQVGDGAILGLSARGELKELVNALDTGDPQTTYTLNSPKYQEYLVVQAIEPPPADPYLAFYVMTDGLAGDLLYAPKPEALKDWARRVDENLRRSASPAQAAAGMLNWLSTYQVKGSWDDRTLVVITKRERDDANHHSAAGQSQSAESTDHL